MAPSKSSDGPKPLRTFSQRAQELLRATPADMPAMPTRDAQAIVHELIVHQIELEVQNEKLRQAQVELEERLSRRTLELAQREHEFRALADNVPALFSYVDHRQCYRYVNRRYEESFQQPASEIVGKTVGQLLGPQRYEAVRPHVEAVLRGQETTYEADLEFADGRHTMYVRYVPDRDSQQRVRGFFALVSDVTEVKRARQQIESMALFPQENPHPVVRVSREGIVLHANPASRRLLDEWGCRRDGRLAPKWARCVTETLQSGGIRQEELALPEQVYSLDFVPIAGSDYVNIYAHDVTERKRAEAALRESETRMRAILNTAADAIITIDRCGVIADVNSATERMFGYAHDELVGENVAILMSRPYCDEHDDYIARYLQTGEARVIGIGHEVVGRRKDGTIFPVGLSVSQVDQLGLFTGIVRDVSEVKALQTHLLEIASDEQRRIGLELHDGTGQELTALSLFAGALLETLQGASQTDNVGKAGWVLEDPEFLRLKHIASRLSQGLAEANRHVEQLSHGILPVQIDAQGLRASLEELAAATDTQRNITCRFQCSGPVAIPDSSAATHLYRIAQEALNNALRHSRADRICISLSQTDDHLVVEVSDNGIGFDPIAGSRPRSAGGSMGLRTMDYRAGLMGGILHIRRKPEGGTLVRCTVPRGRVVYDD